LINAFLVMTKLHVLNQDNILLLIHMVFLLGLT
jgi:hypothetical protein